MATGKGVDYQKEAEIARKKLEQESFVIELGRSVPEGNEIRVVENLGAKNSKHRYRVMFFDPKVCWL